MRSIELKTLVKSSCQIVAGGLISGSILGTPLPAITQVSANFSVPQWLTNVNGTLYFRAYNPATGYELYKSNGTAAGTVLVKDIVPGNGFSFVNGLTDVNGTLFFGAFSPATWDVELYKSDDTADGTVLVEDIFP
jgi:ELWxxDGT repeat protein